MPPCRRSSAAPAGSSARPGAAFSPKRPAVGTALRGNVTRGAGKVPGSGAAASAGHGLAGGRGPLNGYQIMSEIEERSGGAWRPSPGAVYPALSLLADEGLIEGAESAGRRTFSLTNAGREYVEQNPEMARGAWESAAQQEAWEVPGLLRALLTRCGRPSDCWRAPGVTCTRSSPATRTTRLPTTRTHEKAGDT